MFAPNARKTCRIIEKISKEELTMNVLVLIVCLTVAILLAGIISTVAIFALMSNEKFVKWLMGFYMKQIEKSVKYFDVIDES